MADANDVIGVFCVAGVDVVTVVVIVGLVASTIAVIVSFVVIIAAVGTGVVGVISTGVVVCRIFSGGGAIYGFYYVIDYVCKGTTITWTGTINCNVYVRIVDGGIINHCGAKFRYPLYLLGFVEISSL